MIPLAFFRSGDLTVATSYLLGSFTVYPPFYHCRFPLPLFIRAVESWLCCDSSCVCAIDTHLGISDMVIMRLRASLCCLLGSILRCIFGVVFRPPTTGFTGPRLSRAAKPW